MTSRQPAAYGTRTPRPTKSLLACLAALAVVSTACGESRSASVDTSVHVAADRPPSPATWPPYPRFSRASCWTRPVGGGAPLQTAPSYAAPQGHVHVAPALLVHRLLLRFGDRRYVGSVERGSPPPITLMHLRGYFAGARPPKNAQWIYVSAPAATKQLPVKHPNPAQEEAQMIAQWEAALVVGALRDDFCESGGPPLVGWTIGKGGIGLSDSTQALEQRFPNPTPHTFRQRVELIGRRYGFSVEDLRLLHPRQLAPLLVVTTHRDRETFAHDVPAIMKLLNPTAPGAAKSAFTFEGFFFEALDERGPFIRLENVFRGQTEGGEWAWDPCFLPYAHSQPFGTKPCP